MLESSQPLLISLTRTSVSLTDPLTLPVFIVRQKSLSAAWAEADIQAKWDGSSWAKKLANKKKRANLSDFGRFKVMVARKQKSSIIAKKMQEISA
eukprot:scaffold11244_cov246-Chaetoceros_neogracile.AAC.1